jgi:hypothetical protein
MAEETKHLIDEADIGSGEKNAGQKETDKQVEQIADRHPPDQKDSSKDARAQQQMSEGNADTSGEFKKMEKQHPPEKKGA